MRNIVLFAGFFLTLAFVIPKAMDGVGNEPTAAAASTPAAAKPGATTRREGSGTFTLAADARGHFNVNALVDGRTLNFMVDTGASTIALTKSDAERLGVRPATHQYTAQVSTANGTIRAAAVNLASVEIGNLIVYDVRALVLPDHALSQNLLGMSFLSRLKRFEHKSGRLLLEQ